MASKAPAKRKCDCPSAPGAEARIASRSGRPRSRLVCRAADAEFQRRYQENLDMSWIYHDSALEGVVYTVQELRAAIDPDGPRRGRLEPAAGRRGDPPPPRGARLRPRHGREAQARRSPSTSSRRSTCILHPEEGDSRRVKYRKDIPQHRLYFHEYAPPDKITYKVRADRRLDQRSRDEEEPQRRCVSRARALRPAARLPVRPRQRQGRAPAHEPAAPPHRVSRRRSSTRPSASATTRRSRARTPR